MEVGGWVRGRGKGRGGLGKLQDLVKRIDFRCVIIMNKKKELLGT